MLVSIINWLVNLIRVSGYWGVGLSMFLESFFAPIPSELILPFSGFVASDGSLNIVLVLIVATLAAYLGSLPFYIIGYLGEKKMNKFLDKYGKYLFISKSDMEKGYSAFDKYGNIFVLVGRVIPIVRTVISFPAGMSKMPFWIFSIYTIIGTAVWSSLLGLAGYFLGEKWEIVSTYVEKYEKVIIVLIVIAVVLYVIRGIKNMKKDKQQNNKKKKQK